MAKKIIDTVRLLQALTGIKNWVTSEEATITNTIAGVRSDLNDKVDTSAVKQTTGNSETDIISQAGVTTALGNKVDKVSGKSLVDDTQITKLQGLSNQSTINSAITTASNAASAAQTTANSKILSVTGDTYISATTDTNKNVTLAATTKLQNAVTGWETFINQANTSATADTYIDTLKEIQNYISNDQNISTQFTSLKNAVENETTGLAATKAIADAASAKATSVETAVGTAKQGSTAGTGLTGRVEAVEAQLGLTDDTGVSVSSRVEALETAVGDNTKGLTKKANDNATAITNINNSLGTGFSNTNTVASAIANAKNSGDTAQTNLNTHIANKSNPHAVTFAQLTDVDIATEAEITTILNTVFPTE